MKKTDVLEFFGGVKATAHAMDYTTQAIQQWPDELSKGQEAKVAIQIVKQKGIKAARSAFPKSFLPDVG